MSSPLIDVHQRQLYVTTLAGHVIAINCVSDYKTINLGNRIATKGGWNLHSFTNYHSIGTWFLQNFIHLQDSTEVVWRYKFPKPVFSSASLLHDHSIITGCVNGELVKFTPDGTVVRIMYILCMYIRATPISNFT